MSDILKLCKCGGIPQMHIFNRSYQTNELSGISIAYYVECPWCKRITNDNYSKFEAINEWNGVTE